MHEWKFNKSEFGIYNSYATILSIYSCIDSYENNNSFHVYENNSSAFKVIS